MFPPDDPVAALLNESKAARDNRTALTVAEKAVLIANGLSGSSLLQANAHWNTIEQAILFASAPLPVEPESAPEDPFNPLGFVSIPSRPVPDPDAPFRAKTCWGSVCLVRGILARKSGDFVRAESCLSDALSFFMGRDYQGMARVQHQVGICRHWQYRFADAKSAFDWAMQLADKAQDRAVRGRILSDLGELQRDLGRSDLAAASFREALQLARSAGDRRAEGFALYRLIKLALDERRYDEAIALQAECVPILNEVRDWHTLAAFWCDVGLVFIDASNFPEAIRHFQQSLQGFRDLGDVEGEGRVQLNLGVTNRECGEFEAAAGNYEAALALAERVGDRRTAAVALFELGGFAQPAKDFTRASELYQRSYVLFQEMGFPPRDRPVLVQLALSRGVMAFECGDVVASRAFFQEVVRRAREIGEGVPEGIARWYDGQAQLLGLTLENVQGGRADKELCEAFADWTIARGLLAGSGHPAADGVERYLGLLRDMIGDHLVTALEDRFRVAPWDPLLT